jgi:hypothetical protein
MGATKALRDKGYFDEILSLEDLAGGDVRSGAGGVIGLVWDMQ